MMGLDMRSSEVRNCPVTNGNIYILSNPTFPGLLKIGMTRGRVDRRANKLYSTGVPTPFVIEYIGKSSDMYESEFLLHENLSNSRYHPNREFFKVDIEVACAAAEDWSQLTYRRIIGDSNFT